MQGSPWTVSKQKEKNVVQAIEITFQTCLSQGNTQGYVAL